MSDSMEHEGKDGAGKIKVLYIAASGRSGTTIIGNILNELDGWFHVGELREVWRNGVIRNRPCGSGEPFRESELWKSIFSEAFGGVKLDGHDVLRLQNMAPKNKDVLKAIWLNEGKIKLTHEQMTYLEMLSALYSAIYKVTGCSVIVDSSKFPSHLFLLSLIEDLDIKIMHVVRDPRAIAYSWQRKKIKDTGASAMSRSGKWFMWNLAMEGFAKNGKNDYLRVLYEDFARCPQKLLGETVKMVEGRHAELPFISPNCVKLNGNHTVWGNPNRLANGEIELRVDDEWKGRLSFGQTILAISLSWPLMLKYKYLF